MISLRTVLIAVVTFVATPVAAGERCTAMDGQTLQCGRERVRVEGLRAPALNDPGGVEARDRLQRRLRAGEVVIERKGRDRFGRTLGRLYVNGQRISSMEVAAPKTRR